MPKVLSYTPSWLSRPSPGFDVFSNTSLSKPSNSGTNSATPRGPKRTIAGRGTELFVAVGNEIRWSDLLLLKETWEHSKRTQADPRFTSDNEDGERSQVPYRILKVPVSRQIQQVVISPRRDYLAILTSHTVHVAILPDSSHLASYDSNPIRLKTFQLGPMAHVLDQAPIASALWHPLGVSGSCLVTVTIDAVVRLWELDRNNRWSFDNPALAIDLRKLVDGVSPKDDFSPSKYGTNKGYSPDSLEMEVAAACFGGTYNGGENPWALMTLWVAMKEGDIYALCPLLPSKWQPTRTLVPYLSTSIVEKKAYQFNDKSTTSDRQQTTDQQFRFVSEIDKQEPVETEDLSSFFPAQIYRRPAAPGPIPKLQGPFIPDPYPSGDFTVTDIYAIAASVEKADSESEEESFAEEHGVSLSVGVICLATSDCKAHVCLDLDGIEGQWLASQSRSAQIFDDEELSLLLIESIAVGSPEATPQASLLSFTPDDDLEYGVFVTHSTGVSHLSFVPWIRRLEDELNSSTDNGMTLRIDAILDSIKTTTSQPIRLPRLPVDDHLYSAHPVPMTIPTAISIADSDLGHFLLTTTPAGHPQSASLDLGLESLIQPFSQTHIALPAPPEPRPTYQPPPDFYAISTLDHFIDSHIHGRSRRHLQQEPVRLSPATLELLMEAHRVLAAETHSLGVAAAELFRRCERLREELHEQVRRVAGIGQRVDAIAGDDADDLGVGDEGEGEPPAERISLRLEGVRTRQGGLVARYAELRRKLGRAGGARELNTKEKDWMQEVGSLEGLLSRGGKSKARVEEAKRLGADLLDEYKTGDEGLAAGSPTPTPMPQVSGEMNRAVAARIAAMLDRESALVDATKNKLDRLKMVV